ncbi:MAG: B12-binding domain-containing radical SAM protein [Proteobacteria bacterium]|nr:B12-binding domain-containing radical SAM protein [Pseudomonadota bacterium]MBU1710659.1 B12-binding domain-containing radical SAM protein [Pseudomonadota bacterium]
MKILLINPPNCGKSIPEERYGIDSIKQIFRGEPLALEVLAGNLDDHEVRIIDLKVEPGGLDSLLVDFIPDLAGITSVTCEANTVLILAEKVKKLSEALVIVGGIHASNDPEFFNKPNIDWVVLGLGKASFRELVQALETKGNTENIPGVAKTSPGKPLTYTKRNYSTLDLVDNKPPCYVLVEKYRDTYIMKSLGRKMGFVATAFGCPFACSFCCISGLTGRRYITHQTESVIRDIGLLGDIEIIRLLDANTFGDLDHARKLAQAVKEAGINKQFLADVRSDTVVSHPDLMREWKEIGLRAVIIGFEEISDEALKKLNKANKAEINTESIRILHDLGITVIGDFIISPDYDEQQFDALAGYIKDNKVDLPIPSVLTPLPGTQLFETLKEKIVISDLDYYTFTNAVIPTRLDEQVFYEKYAALIKESHKDAKL